LRPIHIRDKENETSRFFSVILKFDDGQTATAYKTEPQLFPQKYGVKLQKHSNHAAGRDETPQTGKTCEAIRVGKTL